MEKWTKIAEKINEIEELLHDKGVPVKKVNKVKKRITNDLGLKNPLNALEKTKKEVDEIKSVRDAEFEKSRKLEEFNDEIKKIN